MVRKANLLAKTIDEFFAEQHSQDLLRFITCGSVDDGKSTLIGRLLWDSKHLFDDQLAALQADSKKFGTQGQEVDFALLVDGLAAEREQGITIDVAYRFFSTVKRKFIVADTPGHEQYTRNMVTAASTADVAILLIDAKQGVLTQTRRHSILASLMGIKHVVLAINKMDLVAYKKTVHDSIVDTYTKFASDLKFTTVTAIPLSALKGDNITERSSAMSWYHGPTLMGYLETVELQKAKSTDDFAFPVQWVNRPNSNFRGFSGTVQNGPLAVGDQIRVTSSGEVAKVTHIVTMDGNLPVADPGQAVTICLDRELDASRGDIFSPSKSPLQTTDQFEAVVIWMNAEAGMTGRSYDLKLETQWVSASITSIKYRIDVNTYAHQAAKDLQLNDICLCNIATTKPIVFDNYEASKSLGSFILVDRFTNATVAAGIIQHTLRRSQNIHTQALTVSRPDRERLNGHRGKVIWFTGLSGSGKSTIANALEVELHGQGMKTYILDGDNVRHGLNKDLGFTEADRVENIRRIAEVAKLMLDAGLVVMTAFISPFKRERQMAKDLIGAENFIEVYVSTPLEVCEKRDVKGLYRQARVGKIPNMTGINSPYEAPDEADYYANTDELSVQEIVTVLAKLVRK